MWLGGRTPANGSVLVEPPKHLGGFDSFVKLSAERFFALNERVRLLPKANLGCVSEVPTVGDNPMLSWLKSGKHGYLRGARHGRNRTSPRFRFA